MFHVYNSLAVADDCRGTECVKFNIIPTWIDAHKTQAVTPRPESEKDLTMLTLNFPWIYGSGSLLGLSVKVYDTPRERPSAPRREVFSAPLRVGRGETSCSTSSGRNNHRQKRGELDGLRRVTRRRDIW